MKHTKRVLCFDSVTCRYFYAESINQVKWFADRMNNYIADSKGNIDLGLYLDELCREFVLSMPLVINEMLDKTCEFIDLPVISKIVIKKSLLEDNNQTVYVVNPVRA